MLHLVELKRISGTFILQMLGHLGLRVPILIVATSSIGVLWYRVKEHFLIEHHSVNIVICASLVPAHYRLKLLAIDSGRTSQHVNRLKRLFLSLLQISINIGSAPTPCSPAAHLVVFCSCLHSITVCGLTE